MKTIGLIFGSTASEHDISVASATSVYKNFPFDKYNCLPIFIKKTGEWTVGNYTQENFENNDFPMEREIIFKFKQGTKGLYYADTMEAVEVDGAILMLHGPVGEGGMVQGILDMAELPYTGCELSSSAVCMDKAFTHQICEYVGIKMAQYQLILSVEDIDYNTLTFPCVVKPSREGSSFGISYAEDKESLLEACKVAFEYDSRVLIEEYIGGQELSVAILKTDKYDIVSKPLQSTRFKAIADFEEKYISEQQEVLFELPYNQEKLNKMVKDSKLIFETLDCRHFSRVDFFITPDEEIYFNEINTIPGFTDVSLYPMLIMNEGLTYTQIIEAFIEDII